MSQLESVFGSIKRSFTPIHPKGYPFILFFLIGTLLLGYVSAILFWIGVVLTLWCTYFFRDPERVTPEDPTSIYSPADGLVSFVGEVKPPEELEFADEKMLKISVFMNVFNCHVNRSPMSGQIKKINYIKGKFINAELDKSSEDNERNALVISNDTMTIGVVQIAGLIARRIVWWCKEEDEVKAGERFGLIRFGSRLDVYLRPKDVDKIFIQAGQTAIAGETRLVQVRG